MKIKKIIAAAAPAFVALGVAALVFAQTGLQTAPQGPNTIGGLLTIISNGINLLFTILIVISVIFIILAAFQFVTAGGDPNGVLMARQKLIWAAVGIIVATLARAIPTVVNNIINKV